MLLKRLLLLLLLLLLFHLRLFRRNVLIRATVNVFSKTGVNEFLIINFLLVFGRVRLLFALIGRFLLGEVGLGISSSWRLLLLLGLFLHSGVKVLLLLLLLLPLRRSILVFLHWGERVDRRNGRVFIVEMIQIFRRRQHNGRIQSVVFFFELWHFRHQLLDERVFFLYSKFQLFNFVGQRLIFRELELIRHSWTDWFRRRIKHFLLLFFTALHLLIQLCGKGFQRLHLLLVRR